MKEEYENVCYGSLEYLEETCLERFSRAVKSGYKGFLKSEGNREYGQFNEETRWDNEVYVQKLSELSD